MNKMDPKTKRMITSAIENEIIIYPIVKNSFEEADKDGSGFIERNELEGCMLDIAIKLGASKPDQKAINEEFNNLDLDKNGKIDFKEFQKFVKKNLYQIVDSL